MGRPPFKPNATQRRILAALGRLAARRAADEAKLTELIAEARALDVPITAIADSADVERKTVYRSLGHPMK